jgi:putative ABC transport system permease protein
MGGMTLGIGIAAAVLMLVLTRDVLLRPLPFGQPDRLVRLLERSDAEVDRTFWPSLPNILDWRAHTTVFDGVAAADVGAVEPVLASGRADRLAIGRVTRGFFETLGVRPVVGRGFAEEENRAGGPAVALVGWEEWQGVLGGRPLEEISLEIGRDVYRVVGVLPAGFRFLGYGNEWLRAGVWLPLERLPLHGGRMSHGYHTVARLRTGIDVATAERGMDELASRLKLEHGEATHADAVIVEPLSDAVLASSRMPLRLLLVAAFGVLVVSCLNLGAALLARGLGRVRELSLRSALGAHRRDLIRLLLAHAAVLAIPGAVVGVAGAWAALRLIRANAPTAVPRLKEVALDPGAVAIALGLALATAVAAGLLPAVMLSVRNVAGELRTHWNATNTRQQRVLWDAFVAGQAALTLVLLVASTMLARSLFAALDVDLGYDPSHVVLASVSLPESRYDSPERRRVFYETALASIRSSGDVTAAGLVSVPPDEVSAMITPVWRDGAEANRLWAGFRMADEGYFTTLGIPIVAGAMDPSSDAVLIDGYLVDALWDGAAPAAGDRLAVGSGGSVAIGGVAGAVRTWNMNSPIGATYVHWTRVPERLLSMHIVARGPDPRGVAAAVRRGIAAADPLVPASFDRLDTRVRASMADRRLMLIIALGFSVVALFLAAAGVYAMVSQAVARRRRESGIRVILGARPRQVRLRAIVLGLLSSLAGTLLGAIASFGAVHLMRSQLFGVTGIDALSIGGPAALLLSAAALAAWLPARRAGRVDPIRLLRED